MKGKAREPRLSVYCGCGSQWHGRYAVDNPVIHDHERRATRNHAACAIVSAAEFTRRGHTIRRPKGWKPDA